MRQNKRSVLICLLLLFLTGCRMETGEKAAAYNNTDSITAEEDLYSYFSRDVVRTENGVTVRFKGFYGKETLFQFSASAGDSYQFSMDCILNQGHFKVCIVGPENSIEAVFNDFSSIKILLKTNEGAYRVLILGLDASGEITINKGSVYE